MKTFQRILIANRGEIACRIVASCHKLGIEAVTLYARDDQALPHAFAGDIAVPLEGESLRETYLNAAQIIAIARQVKADAIHPGYGFLSENADFADAVEKAGIVFIGPSAKVMQLMGDKAGAREAMEAIRVPLIPGYHGSKQDAKTLQKEAEKIGYPVLIKAAAGGGGKGMKIVEAAEEFAVQLQLAKAEALSAFGSDRMIIEKYLVRPRHIEMQVFSDTHGNHLHFYERDCSIQRRHQKIIEESPAPGLPQATRTQLYETATRITSHIGYVGAGTLEFIMDAKGSFYFLEMNTRLQVEHPVTEMVTGLDLVALQIAVAEGRPLPFSQAEVKQKGAAIEVRLYAEDTDRGFLPATGQIEAMVLPRLPNLRVELGYGAGNEVTPKYDPMIAKLVAWGETREAATATLCEALRQLVVAGIITNRAFLLRTLSSAGFAAGDVSTDFIPRYEKTLSPPSLTHEEKALAAAAYLLYREGSTAQAFVTETAEHSAWTGTVAFRVGG